MKKKMVSVTILVLTMLCVVLVIACPNSNGPGPEDENGGGRVDPNLAAPNIAIHRADSSANQFVFTVNPAVANATGYQAVLGNTQVGSSNTPKVTVAGTHLSRSGAVADLRARAVSGGSNGQLSQIFPGMLPYPQNDNPMVHAYRDWFNFVEAGGRAAMLLQLPINDITVNAARDMLENQEFWRTDAELQENNITSPAHMNEATAIILANYDAIMNRLTNTHPNPADVTRLQTTFPRLWFNQVTHPDNDTALGELIKSSYPAVKEVSLIDEYADNNILEHLG